MNTIPFQLELPFVRLKTYGFVGAFILANILLPQAFHAIPSGGKVFLPLFFFTLIASARLGWKVGLLTAVGSPILSSLLFGMPVLAVLPSLLVKGVILSAVVALLFKKTDRFKWSVLALAIVLSQAVGMWVDAIAFNSFNTALLTVKMSWPGLLAQLLLGGLILRQLDKSQKSDN